MTCPFLKETQVRYCQSAAVRKMIPLSNAGRTDGKCSTAEYVSCPIYRAQAAAEDSPACPYLRESLMQYCGAAPVAKFVPYSESLLSRCGNDSHRYCELYLGMAHPKAAGDPDDIALPDWLLYSTNHMWLDVTEDGVCHAGIDAFLSRALGKVDHVNYVWTKGRHRPAAVLTVAGLEMELVFPNPFLLTNCNLYLRADPSRLATEPYTGGWLFEGVPSPDTRENLLTAAEARTWMESEKRRISEFLQQMQLGGTGRSAGPGPLVADGGLFAQAAMRLLERDQMRALFLEFFSPYASGKSESCGKSES